MISAAVADAVVVAPVVGGPAAGGPPDAAPPAADTLRWCRHVGRQAVRALHAELTLSPKPGLVSPGDRGSHDDMDATTFLRSLFALRAYYPSIALAGAQGAGFDVLERLGLDAERRMLAATGGRNTHRGAVFALGLLAAAAGRAQAAGPVTAATLRRALADGWGAALASRAAIARCRPPRSHGQRAAQAHGLRSAGDEAAAGFPVLFDVAWPALRAARAAGAPATAARLQALYAAMAVLDDTNLAHRGGLAGLHWAQARARAWMAAGGALQPDAMARAAADHAAFVARRLSPGGAADLLACACWLDAVVVGAPHRTAQP